MKIKLELGTSVIITRDEKSIAGTAMGFTDNKIRVDWHEMKTHLWGLIKRKIKHSEYVKREEVEVESFENKEPEKETDLQKLFDFLSSDSWFRLNSRRWRDDDEWEIEMGSLHGSELKWEKSVKARTVLKVLQKAVEAKKANTKNQNETTNSI